MNRVSKSRNDLEQFKSRKILKSDIFGHIEEGIFISSNGECPAIRRFYTKNVFIRPLAKLLARNEKRALKKIRSLSISNIPILLAVTSHYHIRSYISGESIHRALDRLTPLYFSKARQLLNSLRKLGVANNDLEKPANWIITEEGLPAIVDFQLAICFKKTGAFAKVCYYEDFRHLLKQKKRFLKITSKEVKITNRKSYIARIWRFTGKNIYLFITRKLLKWEELPLYEERG